MCACACVGVLLLLTEIIFNLHVLFPILYSSSSSLGVLGAHTEAIKVEVLSVIDVSRKVAKECSIRSIKADIEASLSKMEALSHQLCQVTKVKLKHCQGQ